MPTYHAIGLMSGTSLDGLDICYAEFWKNTTWKFQILNAETIPYPKIWFEKLKNAIHLKSEDLLALDVEYGFYLGEMVENFRKKNQLKKIDLIATHGHTVFHQPKRKFTLQIGDGRVIKVKNNFPIVYDFRSQDVILGGNGAPLVPIGDELLFSNYQACLNLGGFSNISFQNQNQRMAFDICPLNIVLNYFSEKLGFHFDRNGELAKNGKVNLKVLHQLNELAFYQQNPPKSLGIEWVIQYIFPLLNKMENIDVLATFTQHIVEQITFVFEKFNLKNCLITGGGALNIFLIEQLKKNAKTEIIIPEKNLIDYKEALIFALMGVLKIRQENNILCSATGSSKNHSAGIVV